MFALVPIFCGAALALAGVCGAGRLAWARRAPHWTFHLAAGAPLLSLAIFLLLSAHLAFPAALVALSLLAAVPLFSGLKKPAWPARPHWFAWLLAPFAVLYLVHALVPETQPDAATYHLGLVAEWLRRHAFAPRIGFYEMLPLGLETLFAPAFAVGAHSAARLFSFAFLAATPPLLLHLARRLDIPASAAAAAALLYVATPVVAISGTSAYNDAALVFFNLAVFALLVEDHAEPNDSLLAHAGLAAGFCYAIKVSGALVVPAVLIWLLWRRRWRAAVWFSAAASLSILPWLLRTWFLTGNPLAPLANRLFVNPSFHASSDEVLNQFMSSYGGVTWSHIPHALLVDGLTLQGLLGPVLVLSPLALLALRRRSGRALLLAAVVLLLPWTRNIGARFLMPALPFVSLSLAAALPAPVSLTIAAAHAVTAWPEAAGHYANENAWRLRGFPWRAALRLEPDSAYLSAHLWEYDFARKASTHIQPDEPVLDLYGMPYAYLPTVPLGPLPSARFDVMAQMLTAAAGHAPETQFTFETRWPQLFTRAVRVRLLQPLNGPWSIVEAAPLRDGRPLPVSANWFVDASPTPAESPLAIDGNHATRWSTWDPGRAGHSWQLRFDRPIPLDGFRLTLPGAAPVAIEFQTLDRAWAPAPPASVVATDIRPRRRAAMAWLKRQGYRWIIVPATPDGHGPIGQSLAMAPSAWGVTLTERFIDLCLFHID